MKKKKYQDYSNYLDDNKEIYQKLIDENKKLGVQFQENQQKVNNLDIYLGLYLLNNES